MTGPLPEDCLIRATHDEVPAERPGGGVSLSMRVPRTPTRIRGWTTHLLSLLAQGAIEIVADDAAVPAPVTDSAAQSGRARGTAKSASAAGD